MTTLRSVMIAIVGLVLLCAPAAADEDQEAAAVKAAEAWLALVDAGNYAQSWDDAALFFRNSITSDQWQKALVSIRQPLGATLSRQLKSKSTWTELPGAPDGEYVVIQFDTDFENKRSSVETVTPMREADGSWRVSGYYIK